MDRYIQVWQPMVPSTLDVCPGPFARNFYATSHEIKIRGTLGTESIEWSRNGKRGLTMDIANQTELNEEQPEKIRKVIESLATGK